MKWRMPNIGDKFKGISFGIKNPTSDKGGSDGGVKSEPPMDRGEEALKAEEDRMQIEKELQRERSESQEMKKEDQDSLLDNLDMFEITHTTGGSNETDGESYMVVSLTIGGEANPLLEEYS
jgi:hypothetical protein